MDEKAKQKIQIEVTSVSLRWSGNSLLLLRHELRSVKELRDEKEREAVLPKLGVIRVSNSLSLVVVNVKNFH